MVIPLVSWTPTPYVWPWNTTPVPWYRSYWGTLNTGQSQGNNFGNVGNAAGFAQALEANWKPAAADSSLNVKTLPGPTAAHVCEGK
jgi:hypothetical protein